MIRLGIVNAETWDFMSNLYPFLAATHETTVFAPSTWRAPVFRERISRHQLRRNLSGFMRNHDVVFFEWASELLAQASRLPKTCPIVTRLHRYELYAWADRVNWEAVDRIILVSEAKRCAFVGRYPAQARKTRVVPVGISVGQFDRARSPFSGSLGTLCHLTPRKRVYDLILTTAPVLERHPGFHLHIGGDAEAAHRDYDDALRHLVERLRLQSRVTFHGPVAKPWEWFAGIDVFISNSYSEGLQVAPMEAMASGCYTLAHEWDGADELLPPECLYLTADALVDKIERFCGLSEEDKDTERRAMRAISVERFDARRVNDRIGRIIESCVRNTPDDDDGSGRPA
jgi:glycosyltransferase involved in cell wall biosynthesis